MAQITSGIRSILSWHWIYDLLQWSVGAHHARQRALALIPLRPGSRILDIGCGTGRTLDYLRDVRYQGFDLNQDYIMAAQKRYGRASFNCGDAAAFEWSGDAEKFDVAIAFALIHHLDDEAVLRLLHVVRNLLNPGGLFVTLDNCLTDDQSAMARWFILRDRGQNIRTEQQYRDLLGQVFGSVETFIHHDLLRIPYTHIFSRCRPIQSP